MRVFLSFARVDGPLAAQFEESLRRNNIETWSMLDLVAGEDWKWAVDNASAKADAYVFLVGAPATAELQTEWRLLFRNDWESKKPLIPVIHSNAGVPKDLPPFLRNRKAIVTANFDDAIDQLRYLIEHPAETIDPASKERSRAELEKRQNEVRDFALFLKAEAAEAEAEAKAQ